MHNPSRAPEGTFDAACALLDAALAGSFRRDLVAEASTAPDLARALGRLRDAMRAHVLNAGAHHIALDRIVGKLDSRTRQDGFHVLHDWDGKADRVNQDTIAVDVLNYVIDRRGTEPPDRTVLAIVLDYYFVYLLALLSLRIWDEGDADGNLDRLSGLVSDLQGPGGSGQRFAETLFLIGTAHFELDNSAYDRLLERTRTLNQAHRTALALVHACSLGSHLRFGFDVTYGRDLAAMRADNGVDYRWLSFSLATLMGEYVRLREEAVEGAVRDTIVEALVSGLSPDARAFLADPPRCLSACQADRLALGAGFDRFGRELLEEFEAHRPSDQAYSPLSFSFNFSHNIVKGIVVDALVWGEPWTLTLDDLLTALPRESPAGHSKERLAATLVRYARASPDTIRGRPMPVIVYDPRAGRQAFSFMMRALKDGAGGRRHAVYEY